MRALANFLLLLTLAGPVSAEEIQTFLTLDDAPKAIFPDADSIERKDVPSDPAFQKRMQELVGRLRPSLWEPFYISYAAKKAGETLGYAVICEEIGKHRTITFIVGVDPQGRVKGVELMAYREPIGDEVRYESFLKQFDQKNLDDPILPRRDIKNISGATLSVRAMSRGVRKALAFLQLTYVNQPAVAQARP